MKFDNWVSASKKIMPSNFTFKPTITAESRLNNRIFTTFQSVFKMKQMRMKNVFGVILIVVFSLSVQIVRAQETAFGLKAGVNLSTLKVDDPEASYDSRTGFHAGVFLRGKFDKIAIQPELLLFTQKGAGNSVLKGKYEDSFTYVSIPVMLKFYPVAGLNIQLGPQFGFLVDGERKYNSSLFADRDITDVYKSSDVSVSLGAGYDFKFGLNMDVRYNVGVKDINNEADGEGAKSRIFQLSLGWNFLRD
jgi:hypothetical protein